MAEVATIARPYAEALFKAAAADRDEAQGWLDRLAAIAQDAQLLGFAQDPNVRKEQVFDLIRGVAEKSGGALPEAACNFLRVVIDNERLAALPEIARQVRELNNAQSGSSDALVYSAFPIDRQALGELSATLEKRFGRKLHLTVREQPELIGGVRVVVGDEVLDTSVRARLEQMRMALTA